MRLRDRMHPTPRYTPRFPVMAMGAGLCALALFIAVPGAQATVIFEDDFSGDRQHFSSQWRAGA